MRGCDRVLAGKLGTVIGGGLGSSSPAREDCAVLA